MKIKSILSADQFSKDDLTLLLEKTSIIESLLQKQKRIPLLKDYIMASLFFEPSTRTRLSFEAAMHRLGGNVITSVGFKFSSVSKGETLYDTLKMIEAYADVCVLRHPVEGASKLAAQNISIPVINAGDGVGEHPTQALLDLYTIYKYKDLDHKRLKIAFIGDIKHGRTIHSLYRLLLHFNVDFYFISPEALQLPIEDRKKLVARGTSFYETEDINAMVDCDIAYVTRIQEERFNDHQEFEKYANTYLLNQEFLKKCRKDIIIMHPLPRLKEISFDLDNTTNAVYFDQAKNGIYSRMALLLDVLGIDVLR